ncbi:MAG: feruloyl-CoA synthase [Rhizobiaceae bacterium]|nr:feruloyl-CoA synthase [Rhizobiaceae bacterium]
MKTGGTAESRPQPGYRQARFWSPDIEVRRTADGVIYVDQKAPLPHYPDRITEPLLEWAAKVPDRTLFAARDADGEWNRLTFSQAVERVRSLGQFLLDAGLSPKRPLVILSGNDLDHASLALAAVHVGIPYAAISPAYSLVSNDFDRLKSVIAQLNPGMVFAADRDAFAGAIEAAIPPLARRLFGRGAQTPDEAFGTALATHATDAVDRAFDAITPDTVAKFLFTSGSTGTPKAVINTHRMICSNQIMSRETLAYFKDEPPVLLDWAPWHHTAGGNKLFFIPVFNGGTLYIDDGNPTPAGVEKTVRNLKDVSPTWYFNVPKGFEALVPHLDTDAELRRSLFRNLKMLWYAGASLAQHTWEALDRLAVETVSERIVIGTGLGATETAPAALMCTWPQERAGNVGLPCFGVSLKLVPMDGKYDARVKGPSITPGYWNAPELTAKAFDNEGYYCFGDALRFADPADASAGFVFDGRTAENFKLDTGTWVNAGALRTGFIDHFGTAVRDVAIAGADRACLSALVFPDMGELRRISGLGVEASPQDVFANAAVRAFFRDRLRTLAKSATGSSTLIRRMLLIDPPPTLQSGEMTDKGSVNQRVVLRNRATEVEELYAESDRVIEI